MDPSPRIQPNPNMSMAAGSSSVASHYGSDTAYEISDIGSPGVKDNNYEVWTEDLSVYYDVTSPVDKFVKYGRSNVDEGLSMEHAIIDKLESFPKQPYAREHHNSEQNMSNGSSLKASHHAEDMSEHLDDRSALAHHGRNLSNESIGSDRSSLRGSESSSLAFPNSNGHGLHHFGNGAEVSRTTGTVGDLDYQLPDDTNLLVPVDQRHKMNRVLMTMHRRLITAKTDMEDLISRLDQEVAVKDYLVTKVKDLEVELEATKQKSKENLEQAILIERERVTQMQWDMEELRRRSMELELKLNSQQDQRQDPQPSTSPGKEQINMLCQELDSEKQQFEELLKRHQGLELKSKADIKILVKEVKSLRSSQAELTLQLKQSLRKKSNMEELLQEERERNEQLRTSWRKLLDKCKGLQDQLQECNVDNLSNAEGDIVNVIPSLWEQLDSVGTSDHIDLLIAEVQHLGEDGDGRSISVEEELIQTVRNIFVENGALRKQVNSLIKANHVNISKSKEKGETEGKSDVVIVNEI